jgi:two-component system chemotaxis response regulator CheY
MSGKTVMCVDDSPTIRKLVRKALEPEGFTIMEAENGKAALEGAVSGDIDFFLVDVNMPIMDGFEFVEELLKNAVYKETPVVFLTTESSADKKQRGKALGVRGWVVKPFEATALVKLVTMLTG